MSTSPTQQTDPAGTIEVETPDRDDEQAEPKPSESSESSETPDSWYDVLLLRSLVLVAGLAFFVSAYQIVSVETATVSRIVLLMGLSGLVFGGLLARLSPRPQRDADEDTASGTLLWSEPAVGFVTGLFTAGAATAVLFVTASLPALVTAGLAVGALTSVLVYPLSPRWSSTASEHRSAVESYEGVLRRYGDRLTAAETAYLKHGPLTAPLQRAKQKGVAAVEAGTKSLELAKKSLNERQPNDFLKHYYAAKRQYIPLRLAVETLETAPTNSNREPPLQVSLSVTDGKTTLTHTAGGSPRPTADWLQTQCLRLVRLSDSHLGTREREQVKRLLTTTEGQVNPDVSDSTVMEAASVIQDAFRRRTQRLRTLSRLLRVGIVVGGAALALLLWVVPLSTQDPSVSQIALFGLFGAITSTILSLRDVSTKLDTDPALPDPSIDLEMTVARLLFGMIAAVALYVMLAGGLLNPTLVPESGGTGLVLTVAFVAGFSERLLRNATERFVTKATKDE